MALANVGGGAHRAGRPGRSPELVLGAAAGGGCGIAHGFGTSSITVVPEPGEEKMRARPPTVFRRPTTDSA